MSRDLPEFVYEALPYLYVLGGVWAISGLEVAPGKLGGMLLVIAGLTVFNLRIKFRSGR